MRINDMWCVLSSACKSGDNEISFNWYFFYRRKPIHRRLSLIVMYSLQGFFKELFPTDPRGSYTQCTTRAMTINTFFFNGDTWHVFQKTTGCEQFFYDVYLLQVKLIWSRRSLSEQFQGKEWNRTADPSWVPWLQPSGGAALCWARKTLPVDADGQRSTKRTCSGVVWKHASGRNPGVRCSGWSGACCGNEAQT